MSKRKTAWKAAVFLIASTLSSIPFASAQEQTLDLHDGGRLLKASLEISDIRSGRILVIKKPAEMPAYEPFTYYAGNDASGHAILWMNESPSGTYIGKSFATIAGAAFAAMDHGVAGVLWKNRYDVAAAADRQLPGDAADPLLYRHTLLRKLDELFEHTSNDQILKTRDQLAWIDRSLLLRTSRSTLYALLKTRGLVAVNNDYNPGREIGSAGCSFEDTHESEWPVRNQPVPHRTGACSFFGQPTFSKNPSVSLRFDDGFTLACSTTLNVDLDFDEQDRLLRVKRSEPWTSCL